MDAPVVGRRQAEDVPQLVQRLSYQYAVDARLDVGHALLSSRVPCARQVSMLGLGQGVSELRQSVTYTLQLTRSYEARSTHRAAETFAWTGMPVSLGVQQRQQFCQPLGPEMGSQCRRDSRSLQLTLLESRTNNNVHKPLGSQSLMACSTGRCSVACGRSTYQQSPSRHLA